LPLWLLTGIGTESFKRFLGHFPVLEAAEAAQPSEMTQPIDLHSLDVFAFCRASGSAEGDVAVGKLPRIIAETAAGAPPALMEGAFRYVMSGFVSAEATEPGAAPKDRLFLDLAVTGQVWLNCQRCLEGYAEPIATSMRFEVVSTEAEAEAAPMDDDETDVIVGSRRFDVLALIEDEILLALPVAPKHPVCPAVHQSLVTGADGQVEAKAPQEEEKEEKRPSPFAALASLKTKH
jgi:uncharacterized protein